MNNYNPEGSMWFRGALVVIALLFVYSIVTDERNDGAVHMAAVAR